MRLNKAKLHALLAALSELEEGIVETEDGAQHDDSSDAGYAEAIGDIPYFKRFPQSLDRAIGHAIDKYPDCTEMAILSGVWIAKSEERIEQLEGKVVALEKALNKFCKE